MFVLRIVSGSTVPLANQIFAFKPLRILRVDYPNAHPLSKIFPCPRCVTLGLKRRCQRDHSLAEKRAGLEGASKSACEEEGQVRNDIILRFRRISHRKTKFQRTPLHHARHRNTLVISVSLSSLHTYWSREDADSIDNNVHGHLGYLIVLKRSESPPKNSATQSVRWPARLYR